MSAAQSPLTAQWFHPRDGQAGEPFCVSAGHPGRFQSPDAGDGDILLQRQPLIGHCYESGRYAKIEYRDPPRPPLEEGDQRWADALLRERGLR